MKMLATEIRKQKERTEMKDAKGQEIIKEAIRSFPDLNANPAAAASTVQPSNASSPLPAYAQSAPDEVKLEIEYLIDLALRKGIGAALSVSAKSPYFVQDAFHDALAGRLYPELKKQGVVQ